MPAPCTSAARWASSPESEADVAAGRAPRRPFVLVAQQSLFDRTRAPEGAHTLWAYCHVPNGSSVDMTDGDRAADRAVRPGLPRGGRGAAHAGPAQVEASNPNYVGGDINGGRRRTCASSSPGRCSGPPRTPRPTRGSSCARPRLRPAAACTACAGGSPPGPRFGASWPDRAIRIGSGWRFRFLASTLPRPPAAIGYRHETGRLFGARSTLGSG